ncbi:MAG: L,D-transpeptidase [Victivallaceae bacterium]|nr:L,D-transpeptidase [Victivallaceae bacterium]
MNRRKIKMTPVGYTFKANKPVYHSRKQDGAGRRIIIFALLTGLVAAILYFWVPGGREEQDVKKSDRPGGSVSPAPAGVEKPPAVTAEQGPAARTVSAPARTKPSATAPAAPAAPAKLPVAAPRSFPDLEALLAKAEAAEAQGQYGLVRKYGYRILASRRIPDENPLWEKTVDLLGRVNIKIFFSDVPFPEKKVSYQIKPNDGLRKIAMQHNTSMEAVQRSNRMKLNDTNVELGKTFNIYVGDWKIVISKSRKKLYLFDGKEIFKAYTVGIGKQNRTPTGIFKTGGKRKNPDWYAPTGKISFGDKGNVLGTRWIRLIPDGECSREVSGLGIHGTWEPETIGKASSNGCIRLTNPDIEELFAILPNELKPVPVKIIE